MSEFNFGDIVTHNTMGKGVFLGKSITLYPDLPEIRHKVEVIFDRQQASDSVNPNHLVLFRPVVSNPDLREVSFTDSAGEKYDFRCVRGNDLFIKGSGKKLTNIMVKDVQKFIDCLSEFLDFSEDD